MATYTEMNLEQAQTVTGQKTMTAPILNGATCGANPTAALGVATKQYVDAIVTIPTGLMFPYGGAAAPAGYLSCDGSAVSRATYAALFAVLGSTYGAGDGSTTFNLPDKRGRGSMGAGAGAGLTARTRGTKLGNETHLLTSAESGQKAINTTMTVGNEDGQVGSDGFPSNTIQSANTGTTSTVTGPSIAGTSAASAHDIMNPFEVDLWIIKT